MAAATGRVAFSLFEDDGYSIYTLDLADVVALVPPAATLQAAVLPGRTVPSGDVHRLLSDVVRGLPEEGAAAAPESYDGALRLDDIGQPTIQGTVYGRWHHVQGGVSVFFSDMLAIGATSAFSSAGLP
jgi:hypothetical protein